MDASVESIHALLPQTQCTRCGFDGCRPYAEAIARGEVGINRCPPGGSETLTRLASLLEIDAPPLDPACGVEGPPQVALIDASRCIGCARCLPPCPVDAIVGASRQLHVVLESLCTGCELCIAPCPVDCITLVPRAALDAPVAAPTAADNLRRFTARESRHARRETERLAVLAERKRRAAETAGS